MSNGPCIESATPKGLSTSSKPALVMGPGTNPAASTHTMIDPTSALPAQAHRGDGGRPSGNRRMGSPTSPSTTGQIHPPAHAA